MALLIIVEPVSDDEEEERHDAKSVQCDQRRPSFTNTLC